MHHAVAMIRRTFMDELKDLLRRAQSGEDAAKEQLFAVAYAELRSLARAQLLREGGRNTLLDTTVLVHECWLRFHNAGVLTGTERGHFFSYVAQVMRSVIVDSARKRLTERRGGDADHVSISMQLGERVRVNDDEVIQMDEALEALQKVDERLVRIVEMRYFAGMTVSEVAAVLGVTERTVGREWMHARLFLFDFLR